MDLHEFENNPRMVKKTYDKVCYLRGKEKQNMVLPSNDPFPLLTRTEAWVNAIDATASFSCAQNQNGISRMKNILKMSFQSILCAQTKKP